MATTTRSSKTNSKSGRGTKTGSKPTRTERPKMTAQEATNFEGFSARSYQQIEEAIEFRKEAGVHVDCECVPYENTLTFARWIAIGRCVRKGEKAIQFSSFVPVPDKTGNNSPNNRSSDEPAKTRLIPKTLSVFCLCQTDPIESKK